MPLNNSLILKQHLMPSSVLLKAFRTSDVFKLSGKVIQWKSKLFVQLVFLFCKKKKVFSLFCRFDLFRASFVLFHSIKKSNVYLSPFDDCTNQIHTYINPVTQIIMWVVNNEFFINDCTNKVQIFNFFYQQNLKQQWVSH